MMKFYKGHKFTVCSLEELCKDGWGQGAPALSTKRYSHKDFPKYLLPPEDIMSKYEGKTLTVDKISTFAKNCYWVEENIWEWPVAAFDEMEYEVKTIHVCIEGMTPIDGWFICKHCGMDLRRINEKSWKLGATVRLRLTF